MAEMPFVLCVSLGSPINLAVTSWGRELLA